MWKAVFQIVAALRTLPVDWDQLAPALQVLAQIPAAGNMAERISLFLEALQLIGAAIKLAAGTVADPILAAACDCDTAEKRQRLEAMVEAVIAGRPISAERFGVAAAEHQLAAAAADLLRACCDSPLGSASPPPVSAPATTPPASE